MARSMQTAFSAGELSPSLHSHADLGKYHTGLAQAVNWFVKAQGGASTRSGFKYINTINDSSNQARLINFQFNTEQSYALVFTNLRMRVIRDGGTVLEPNKTITGATNANPIEITTSAAHGYVTNEDVFIADVVGMTDINNRFWRITVTGANTYTLNGSNGVPYDAYVSGGTSGRVFEINTPYPDSVLFDLKFTQSADTMTITHPDYTIRTLTRSSHYNWTISTVSFSASLSPPSSGLAITQVGTTSGSPAQTYRYVVTSISEDGDESVASAVVTSGSIAALNTTWGNHITWDAVAGADYYNVYKEFSLDSDIFGWVGESESEEYKDFNFGPDMSYTPPRAKNPFSGANNQPACTAYHQQRQWYGATNTNPDTVWGTRTADYDNMDVSRPTRSDDAIEFTLAAQEVNEVRHMVSLDELLVFTSGAEWKVVANADGVITPANVNPRTQGFRGCSRVRPLVIGETALFVQEKGSRVRDIKYTFESDKYSGNDLTVLARHLFEGHEIIDWAYAQEPYSVVWVVRDDGVLLAMTYLQEHDVYAWTRHTTQGYFESVCTTSEGLEDVLYAVIRRAVNGVDVRYIERMQSRMFANANRAFCVDSGLTYVGPVSYISSINQANPAVVSAISHTLSNDDVFRITAVEGMDEVNGLFFRAYDVVPGFTLKIKYMDGTPVDSTAFAAYISGGAMQLATKTITGLHHLKNAEVVALADGNVESGMQVNASTGSISLQNWACLVHAGLPYVCDLESLEVSFPQDTVQSRKKQVARVAVRVEETRGLKVGPNFDEMYDFEERSTADNYDNLQLITGQQVLEMASGWTDYGKVCIRQDHPLPASVLALIPEIEISG